MSENPQITSPDDPLLDELCQQLAEQAEQTDLNDSWPGHQLQLCGRYGVYQWFLPVEHGGQGWSDVDIYRGYLKLSAACLNTTFVITQLTGACRRIATARNAEIKSQLLPSLLSGEKFGTLAISHLTTSRRHLDRPVLRGEETDQGFVLDGFSPWVTGGLYADVVVTGATMDDGRQFLIVVPTDLPGIEAPPPAKLVGLTASMTGQLHFDRVQVDRRYLLAGPSENVMKLGEGTKTGGLQTSTLALGLAMAAIEFIHEESQRREDLLEPAAGLQIEFDEVRGDLLASAAGDPHCSNEDLRVRANSLVLRASQAALAAAKGTGYVVGHPAGRWCREALFFLVWSCPQQVMAANLCEFAGISD